MIARKGRRTCSRSTTRADRLELIVASDGSADAHRRARPRRGRRPRARPPARRQDPRPGPGRRAARRATSSLFSDANSTLGARRAPRAGGAVAPTRRSATSAARCASPTRTGTNQEGVYWRYEMAVRELESRVGGVTAGNGAIYATRREAYIVVDPRMGHDLSFPFNMVKRGWRARVRSRARAAAEKMVPSNEGEFRRKRRMMSHAWPIVLTGGMPRPARLPAPLRAPDLLAPAAALRLAVPARDRAWREHRACWAAARLPARARRPARVLCGRRARPPAAAPVQARALLRARHGVARRRPRSTTCAPARPPAGRRRRARGDRPRARHRSSSALALVLSSPLMLVAMVAIRIESPGSPIYRQRRVGKDGEPFEMLKLRTMVSGAEHKGAGMAVNYGDARITRVGAHPAPLLARRAAELRERAARRDVGRRPAPDDPGAGRPVHRPRSAAASR